MKLRIVISVLLAMVLALGIAGAAGAAGGKHTIVGNATRDYQDPLSGITYTDTVVFNVAIKGNGTVSGTWSFDNGQGNGWSGNVTCAWVSGNTAGIGAFVTDNSGSSYNAEFLVADNPDAFTVYSNVSPPCGQTGTSTGFVTTGSIKIR